MRAEASRATISSVAATVLIVDDHTGFRTFARALLETEGFDVVGEATDGASALALARTRAAWRSVSSL
jgi:DNA-binding NarL/FixJ family response regulator